MLFACPARRCQGLLCCPRSPSLHPVTTGRTAMTHHPKTTLWAHPAPPCCHSGGIGSSSSTHGAVSAGSRDFEGQLQANSAGKAGATQPRAGAHAGALGGLKLVDEKLCQLLGPAGPPIGQTHFWMVSVFAVATSEQASYPIPVGEWEGGTAQRMRSLFPESAV